MEKLNLLILKFKYSQKKIKLNLITLFSNLFYYTKIGQIYNNN